MLHLAVEDAFEHLLATWRAHESRRSTGALSVTELAQSRWDLDRARDRMHLLRIAIHPHGDELGGAITSLWCETLDSVVHLRVVDRDPDSAEHLRCPCGHVVPFGGTQGSLTPTV